MFNISILLFICFTGLISSEEGVSSDNVKTNFNETQTSTIIVPTISQTNESNVVVDSKHNLTMLAKKDGNLIVNGNGVALGRKISPEIESKVASSNTALIIVITVLVAVVIVGGVLGAIFVMKRRLFVWNLNDKKSDGANGVLTNASSENGSVNKCEGVIETKTEEVNETEEKKEQVKIETIVENVEEKPQETNLTEQNASSSLVVNVLNELNEVNEKAKSNANLDQIDAEKQPLNNNE
ncbi:unnamed protein product [Brachionus calyciflorus]|uniref:Uncharacterized protein n=1 Tax=Brachionus calyciflorus TaxID=104777 RepID=A0A813Z480_9BILA|nr:unnamed protein product [Brachionus calyciflorus]